MKFLSLNLYKGKCLQEVLAFIKEEQFDLIHMQEVTGAPLSFPQVDCFEEIKDKTGLHGELIISWSQKGIPGAYFGNATFYKPSLILKERIDLRFKPFQELEDPENLPPALHPKNALFLRFQSNQKEFWSINTHMSWGPTPLDEPYKIANAETLSHRLRTLDQPFILSGDFNVTMNTEVIKMLEPYGRNLTREYGITNTLNADIHKAQHLFPPGLAVDYIFTHPAISINHFKVIEQRNLSDHMGLVVEFLS